MNSVIGRHNKQKQGTPTFTVKGAASLGRKRGLLGAYQRVRSKASGQEGLLFPNDPHVYIEGNGVGGWYRVESIDRDFIRLSGVIDPTK